MGPLSRYRILDMTLAWAGPFCSRLLADMGAQVIKVEATRRPDMVRGPKEVEPGTRGYPNDDPSDDPWNRNPRFNERNRNKLGITLDLTTQGGLTTLKELVKISDVVVDSFSARVLSGLGLDYAVLKRTRPDIILLSMPGFGITGPWRDYTSFGSTIEQVSGMISLTGYDPDNYMRAGFQIPDGLAGIHGAGAILVALYYRDRTGIGQHIDMSQQESAAALLGGELMHYTMNGVIPRPRGNQDPGMAPHGCYRCKGQDSWVTIAVGSEEEWQGLCKALGREEWLSDPRFRQLEDRLQNRDELDLLIQEWTKEREPYQVMFLLQRVRVPCGPVLATKDQFGDPHLRARRMFELMDHPSVGSRESPGIVWKLSRTPGQVVRAAPTLGQHNNIVLGELLGLTEEELAGLEREGVIGTVPLA